MVDLENVKIMGASINAVTSAFISEGMAKSILGEHLGTEDVDSNAFYPATDFQKVLDYIGDNMIFQVVRRVGTRIIDSAKWPPGVKNAEEALASVNEAYKLNHEPNTPEKIGTYTHKKINDSEHEMHCDNPYPCALDEGIIYGAAKKFHPKAVAVKHVEGPCRSKGDEKCVYSVKLY